MHELDVAADSKAGGNLDVRIEHLAKDLELGVFNDVERTVAVGAPERRCETELARGIGDPTNIVLKSSPLGGVHGVTIPAVTSEIPS